MNPRARQERDTRSAEEILAAIAAKGREVDAALERLKALMDTPLGRATEEESP